MKSTHTHKFLSLLLALAMAFSLAAPAFGAELDTAETAEDEITTSETSDSEDWDTLPITDSDEEDSSEEETADSSAESSAEGETDAGEADAGETEDAETAGEEGDAETETETETEEVLVTDPDIAEEDDTSGFALSEDDEGWVYTLDEDGDLVFAFVYLEDEAQVFAASGYYQLPAGTVEVVQGETTTTYSFAAGIYYFDADGIWEKTLSSKTTTVSVTTVEEKNGVLSATETASKLIKSASATVKETESGYSVSSNTKYFSGKSNSRYYYEGELYTGLFRFSAGDTLWMIKNGVGGTKFTGTMKSSSGTYICNYVLSTSYDGCYYKSGKVYTGYLSSNRTYYKNGKKNTSISGWKTIGSKEYYFTKGVAASGTKRIKRNGYTYTYTFRSDGSLVTNLFEYNSSYKKKKLHIVLARGSHTGTILAYNSSTKKYDIPVKSFVVSMSKKSSNTKPGTYKLSTRKRWWKYKAGLWYQYATCVSGSGSWTHSEQYSKASVKALKYKSYNGLGTNQSKQCIRMQVVNCKLIYDLAKSNGSNIRVVITRGNGYLPFGKMSLSNNYDATGKIKSSKKYDPTDPAV